MFKMDIVSGNEQTYHIDNANITHMWTFKILLIHYVFYSIKVFTENLLNHVYFCNKI